MASTSSVSSIVVCGERRHTDYGCGAQWGLKDESLVRSQGFIDGQWVDAKEGGKFVVTSEACLFFLVIGSLIGSC